MFPEAIKDYILYPNEEINLEFKGSMDWNQRDTKWRIIQSMLAMVNNADGGIIVIGVEEGDNKKFQPLGMKKSDFNSFSHDHVSDKIKEYSDPVIKFKLLADTIEMEGEERSFVVIQVLGSSDITICTKSEKWNMDIDFLPRNMALRKNAVYIRSETPVSSREINSAQEWRELIDGIVQKNKQDLLKKLPCSGIHKDIEPSDDKKFNKDLKDDDL